MKDKLVTVTYTPQNGETVPLFRLRGKWLEAAGFPTGRRVRVELVNGALILTPQPQGSARRRDG